MGDVTIILFFAAILIFAGLLFAIIAFTKRDSNQLDVTKYQADWLAIERQLKPDDTASFQLAILNADKLLDRALRQRNIKGQTMGERMKTFQKHWSKPDAVWAAHKMRNRIAHESDVKIDYVTARRA
ncbi:hypothetical protein B7Z17_00195, partial [Candidatus Saccharibacteria bacterium 32-49-10]